jgi:radical SAM superfamily enzyme YgiQ (UPF0313 family)
LTGKRIVFLAVNASYSHSSLAAWSLRSALGAETWEWHTVEATINDSPAMVLDRVMRLRPDVLASTLYLFNRRVVVPLLKRFRRLMPECRVIVGGPECGGDNRQLMLEERVADAAIRGEGERALADWLGKVGAPHDWASIPGFCGVVDGVYQDNGVADAVGSLDDIPAFYSRELDGFRKPFVQLETARGCANHCLFCTSRETAVRYHSLSRVRCDLKSIQDAGVRDVRVVDRTFNECSGRSLELVRMFRDEFPGLRFHLEIDPALVTDELARELADAGPARFHVEAGVQSLSVGVYRKMGRATTASATLKGLERLLAIRSLEVHVDLISGLPGGTMGDLLEDVRVLVSLGPAEIQLERLKLLPGTPLATAPDRWGLVAAEDPPYETLRTPDMSFEELCRADRVSKILDWWHNVPVLQATFIAGTRNMAGFMGRFDAFLEGRTDFQICPSLEQRFRWLDAFLALHDVELVQALRYKWFRLGFSAKQGPCVADLWKGPIPETAILVEGDRTKTFSQKWRVELESPYLFCYGRGEKDERAVLAVFKLVSECCRPSP